MNIKGNGKEVEAAINNIKQIKKKKSIVRDAK